MRRQYTRNQRAGVLDLVRSGAATITEAAVRLGVTRSTAYYWVRGAGSDGGRGPARGMRAAKAAVPSQPTFVRVVPSSTVATALAVRVGAAEIQVRRGFDPELLRAVVAAIGGQA